MAARSRRRSFTELAIPALTGRARQAAVALAGRPAWLPGLLATILATIPAWLPLLRPDFDLWQLYDAPAHLRRAYFLAQAIREGTWYPRWTPEQYGGYGYPTLDFYAPATYYLTLLAAGVLPKVGIYGAYQILSAGAALGIIGGMYLLGWNLWRHAPAAALGAGAVAYAPYVLPVNLYLTGSLPHALGLGLLLWLMAACLALWQHVVTGRPAARWWWGVAGLTAAILLTHHTSAAIGAVVMVSWLACLTWCRPSRRALVLASSAASFGALLAAACWLPALVQTPLVQVERMHRGNLHYRNQFLRWPGYHAPLWGLQARSPWTPGAPIDLHPVYPHPLPHEYYGPIKLGLWQGVLSLAAAGVLAATAVRPLLQRRRAPVECFHAGVDRRLLETTSPPAAQEPALSHTCKRVPNLHPPPHSIERAAGRPGWTAHPATLPPACGPDEAKGGEALAQRNSVGVAASSQQTAVASEGTMRRRLAVASVAFGLALFLGCYAQSFDWALPLWERFAALRALQFPSRLFGPAIFGVALASGGSLALVARASRRTWLVAGVAIAILACSGTAGRRLTLDPEVARAVDATTIIEAERRHPGFVDSSEEFLPRTSSFEVWHEGEARGFWLFERLFPEASWLGGRVRPWNGAISVHRVMQGPLWLEAEVDAGTGGGTLAFHQLAFPGWRAWVDRRPVEARPAPLIETQAIRPGFILVDVPPGARRVAIRFGPNGPRLAGAGVSLGACLLAAGWLAALARRRWYGWRRIAAWCAAVAIVADVGLAGSRLRLAMPPPAAPGAARQIVIVNVIDRVQAGNAQINAPTGSALGPDQFVDVRFLTVRSQDRPLADAGPATRRWLFMHPPAAVSVDLLVPDDGYLQAGVALDPAVWEAPLGDGVRFRATVTPAGAPERAAATVLDVTLHPRGRGEQRRWIDLVADLRPWAGQQVRLTLATDARQDPWLDWAGWSEPAVVRLDPVTAARLLHSTAETTRIALRPESGSELTGPSVVPTQDE